MSKKEISMKNKIKDNWKFYFIRKNYPSWIYALIMSIVAVIIFFVFFN